MKYIIITLFISMLYGCKYNPTEQGQQYRDGEFITSLNLVQNELALPINIDDYRQQIALIKLISPSLYKKNQDVYLAIDDWIEQSLATNQFNRVGLSSYQLAGTDNYGNVHLTSYYTPVLKARSIADDYYRYPLYSKPIDWQGDMPSRAEIYNGAFAGRELEIAYTASLIDNFIMEVQGSGYIDFEDDSPLVFFGYSGKNGHPYQSIGRLLIESGDIERDKISLQAIKAWADTRDDSSVINLLNQNASTVFFKPQYDAKVIGSAGVPLIAGAAIASDKSMIATGSVVLVEVPLLDEQGKFTGQRQSRLMVALDVGGAIKGHHFDIYQGIGDEAGVLAGFYNHYGRAWLLLPPPNSHLAEASQLSL